MTAKDIVSRLLEEIGDGSNISPNDAANIEKTLDEPAIPMSDQARRKARVAVPAVPPIAVKAGTDVTYMGEPYVVVRVSGPNVVLSPGNLVVAKQSVKAATAQHGPPTPDETAESVVKKLLGEGLETVEFHVERGVAGSDEGVEIPLEVELEWTWGSPGSRDEPPEGDDWAVISATVAEDVVHNGVVLYRMGQDFGQLTKQEEERVAEKFQHEFEPDYPEPPDRDDYEPDHAREWAGMDEPPGP